MEPANCQRCGQALKPGRTYHYQGQDLCEACCLYLRQTRPRKTHWQYLGAIRSQYLQEPPERKDNPKGQG